MPLGPRVGVRVIAGVVTWNDAVPADELPSEPVPVFRQALLQARLAASSSLAGSGDEPVHSLAQEAFAEPIPAPGDREGDRHSR